MAEVHEVDYPENCALQGCYAAYSGNSNRHIQTAYPRFLDPWRCDRLVAPKHRSGIPPHAAQFPWRAHISSTSRRNLEITYRLIWLTKETSGKLLWKKKSNEIWGSIKDGEFVEQLRNFQLLYKHSAPGSYCCITDGLLQSKCKNVQYSRCYKTFGHSAIQMVNISS